jgi:UDP-MurNAc hydroxylase
LRFTVLGHGALAVEAAGKRLLVDPWLLGSCYWRSWWHYPPTEVRDEDLAPDLVYLSHHHFDHFHYPSMRKLARTATVLVPRFAVDVMPKEVRSLGFERVQELAHGDVVELAPGLRAASFQYGFDDSALLLESSGVVLADLNDCKVRGRALQEVLDVFGRPTFLFKSHSWAQAYPVRYTSDDPAQLALVSRESYVADFVEMVDAIRPGFAVPFASMVCFLHPETADVNASVVTPKEVADGFAAAPVDGSEVVVLAPGDGWSVDGGFEVGATDWFEPSVRARTIDELREQVEPKVESSLAAEAGVTVEWSAFEASFTEFVRSLPPGSARFLLPRPVTFHVPSGGATPAWVVDARRRTVERRAEPPKDNASVIHVSEAVLADALGSRTVNLIHISLRLRVDLAPGGVDSDLAFWGLLAMWELGYLPLQRVPRRRLASAVWRRRREILETVTGRLLKRGSFAERMTAGMIVTVDAPDRPPAP